MSDRILLIVQIAFRVECVRLHVTTFHIVVTPLVLLSVCCITYCSNRLSSGSGNSVSTQSVAAGKDGIVVAAQTSVASIEHRDSLTVNGHKVADYGGNDAVLLGESFGSEGFNIIVLSISSN